MARQSGGSTSEVKNDNPGAETLHAWSMKTHEYVHFMFGYMPFIFLVKLYIAP